MTSYNSNTQIKQLNQTLKKQQVMEGYIRAQLKASKNLKSIERDHKSILKQKRENETTRRQRPRSAMPTHYGTSRRFDAEKRQQTIQQQEEPKGYFQYKDSDDESDCVVKKEPEEKTDHLCDYRMKQMFNVQNQRSNLTRIKIKDQQYKRHLITLLQEKIARTNASGFQRY